MPDDSRNDWRWIDEHIERLTPEIATDAVLAKRGEDGASQDEEGLTMSEHTDRAEREREETEHDHG